MGDTAALKLTDQIELERERLSTLWQRERRVTIEVLNLSRKLDVLILQYYQI